MSWQEAVAYLSSTNLIPNVPLPQVTNADANKLLVVNNDATGYILSAGEPVTAGVNSIAIGNNTIGITPPEGTGDVTLIVNPDLELDTLTVGNVAYPAVLGNDGEVLSVVNGALAFAAGGGGNMLPAGDNINYDNNTVNLDANITGVTSLQTSALTVGELTIPATLGTNDQVLGVSGGQLAFIDQSGTGGIAGVSGVGNIQIDSITDPAIPAISTVDIPTFHSMNLVVEGSAPYINVTEQLHITSTDPSIGVKMYFLKDQAAQVIIDGTEGIVSTNEFTLNSGTTQNIDYVQSSGMMAQEAYIYTSFAESVNFPSYGLPKITDDSNIAQNLIMATTTPVSNNNPMEFITLDAMFDAGQDIRYTSNGTDNKIISEINTANNKAAGAFLQCTGINNGDLTWATITQDGTIAAGLNIEADTQGQTTTISTVINPTFSGNVTCQANLSTETFTLATFDVSVPVNPTDLNKVLTFTDADGTAGINWVTPSAQALTAGTNINITDDAINLDAEIEVTALTLNNTVLAAPQQADAGKFLQYNEGTNTMNWVAVSPDGIQSITGTLNQIEVTPGDDPTISFPMTTMYFPYSVVTRTEEGLSNVAIGESTLQVNDDGANNVAIGGACLASNTSGGYNVAIGNNAMNDNTSGTLNIAIGKDALSGNTASSNNVIIGGNAAPILGSTGVGNGGNIVIGAGTAASLTTGENNIIIGTSIDVGASTSNRIVLGSNTNNQLSIPGCGIDYDITSGSALTVSNGIRAGSVSAPSLSVHDANNPATLYTLPAIVTGDLPTVGDVIAYQSNGQCTFVPQSGGGGGNVNEVIAGDNITLGGTQADPVVNVNPNLTAIESISMTGATSVISSGQTTQFVCNTNAGQVIQLINASAGVGISLDSANGIIKTATYPVSGGISAGNHIQTTDVIVQSLFVTSKQTTGNLYSYKFPEITTATAIPVNSLLAMGSQPDVNFSQNVAYTQLESLIANVADSDVIADGTLNNQTPLILKTSNSKVANYILAVGSNGVALEWILNANTTSTTTYALINNFGSDTYINMYLTAYARNDGFRSMQVAGAYPLTDESCPIITKLDAITATIQLPFYLGPADTCLQYVSGDSVDPVDFVSTYSIPALRQAVPIQGQSNGVLSAFITLGRLPISYSVGGTLTAQEAYCEVVLESGSLDISFIKNPGSGYGAVFDVPIAKYVQFSLPGYPQNYPMTFNATFFAI